MDRPIGLGACRGRLGGGGPSYNLLHHVTKKGER